MCVVSIMMGGSMQRYIADYAWIFIIASCAIFVEIINLYKSEEAKNILEKILGILTIYIVLINFFSGIISEKSYMQYNAPEQYYQLKYSIDFWE